MQLRFCIQQSALSSTASLVSWHGSNREMYARLFMSAWCASANDANGSCEHRDGDKRSRFSDKVLRKYVLA